MKSRWRTLSLSLMAAMVLAVGGATLVHAGSHKSNPGVNQTATASSNTGSNVENATANDKADSESTGNGPDTDKVQQGDQSGPDVGGADNGGPNDAADSKNGEQKGSEAPNNDGPNGHADEPGNPTADHQFNGQE